MNQSISAVPATTVITVESFDRYIALLAQHDWYYDFSDDPTVFRNGASQSKVIRATAMTHPIYRKAYEAWVAYTFKPDDVAWGDVLSIRSNVIVALRQQVIGELVPT